MRALPLILAAALPALGVPEDGWDLFRGLVRCRVIEVVCSGEELSAAAQRAIDRAGEAGAEGHELRVIAPADSDSARPRIALGSFDDPWMRALAEKTGFLGEGPDRELRLQVSGALFTRGDEVLIATVADPERPGLPLTLYLAAEAHQVAAQLEELVPCSRPGVVVCARGALLFELPYLADGTPDWVRCTDYQARRRDLGQASALKVDDVVLHLPQGVDPALARAYGAVMSVARQRARKVLDRETPGTLDVRVLGSVQELLSLRGAEELAHASPSAPGDVEALLAERLPHDGGAAAARATALELLGMPAADWLLDGIGALCAETWWGKRRPDWVAHLRSAGLVPPVSELVAPDAARRLSPHVVVPLRGELLAHLVSERGSPAIARLWSGEDELVVDARLQADFEAQLDGLVERLGERVEEERRQRAELVLADVWFDGVCFVPGGDPADAFGGDVRQSLIDAREAGARAIALMPFAYLDARPRLFAGLPPRPAPDASPGDLALASAVLEARALGMRVMLAPQILATPGGTWADSIALGGDAGIEEFFADYARALQHYALLGELLGVDLLCLGSERGLVSATRPSGEGGDDSEVNLERYANLLARWRELIADVRRAFGGRLTYAAEATHELQRVAFWGDLDFVGVNLFPSVSQPRGEMGRRRTRERLASSVASCLDEAARAGKPLLITQVGFPSHTSAAMMPLLARGTVDLELQAELIGLLSEVLDEARAKGHLAGVLLWRWDPDPRVGGAADPSHTPQGKPAESLLKSFFAR
jgi:hypothetical protein